jgi:hypothetical protein
LKEAAKSVPTGLKRRGNPGKSTPLLPSSYSEETLRRIK